MQKLLSSKSINCIKYYQFIISEVPCFVFILACRVPALGREELFHHVWILTSLQQILRCGIQEDIFPILLRAMCGLAASLRIFVEDVDFL